MLVSRTACAYQLRNHATHVGFPSLQIRVSSAVHAVEKPSSATYTDQKGVWSGVLVWIDRERLITDGKLKAEVRDEVRTSDAEIEIGPAPADGRCGVGVRP